MAKIYLHAMVKELAGRSSVECRLDRPTPLADVLAQCLSEREKFLIIDELGAVRRHLNIYANSSKIRDPMTLVNESDSIDIFPAVSGG